MADISAFRFDGAGNGVEIAPERVGAEASGPGFDWVHLSGESDAVMAWLSQAPVDELSHQALTADETRPRCTVHGKTVLLNLRGVNLSPGAEPEDMASLRCFLSERLVITYQRHPLWAVREVIAGIGTALSPTSPGDLLARVALRLADRAEPVVATLNEQIDDLEELVIDGMSMVERRNLADVRRVAIVLRRYMFPQRDALATFEIEDLDWLHGPDRSHLREAAERVTRLGEELDAIRDRAQVVHEAIVDMRAEAMNKQMLVLSVVAAIFLPLGLITGLLGINVGGIPGAQSPWAFWEVCALLLAVSVFQLWLFRRMGLIGKR